MRTNSLHVNLKEKDIEVLSLLRQNSREKVTNLSRRTGIPASSIYDMVRKYEKRLIKGNTILLDFTKLGFISKAYVSVKVSKTDKFRLYEYLSSQKCVNSVYGVYNEYDVLFETICTDMGSLQRFLDDLDRMFKIEGKQVLHITEDIARERFFTYNS